MTRFIEEFQCKEDIIKQFEAPCDALDDAEILLAWYGYGSYCGSAFVLFRKDGKLYEANGSHCSCYGLEGQWEPEETSKEALALRKIASEYSEYDSEKEAQDALEDVLATL